MIPRLLSYVFTSSSCLLYTSLRIKQCTHEATNMSYQRTLASTEKLRGENESTLRAWQTKKAPTIWREIRHEDNRFRPHPVQSGASQIGFGWQPDANRSKPSQNGGVVFELGRGTNRYAALWLHQLCRVLFNLRNVIICLRAN